MVGRMTKFGLSLFFAMLFTRGAFTQGPALRSRCVTRWFFVIFISFTAKFDLILAENAARIDINTRSTRSLQRFADTYGKRN